MIPLIIIRHQMKGGTYNTTNIYDRIWASQVPEDSNQHSFTAAADDKKSDIARG